MTISCWKYGRNERWSRPSREISWEDRRETSVSGQKRGRRTTSSTSQRTDKSATLEMVRGTNVAATIRSVVTRIPAGVAANCLKSPERMTWLEGLPAVVQKLEHRWNLTPDGPPVGEEPSCSYVEAVRRADGTASVLKISMPHMEQEHETDGLRFWNGDPTVRLLETEDELRAMLLERCQPGTTLRVLDECEQDIVISGLLRRLWRPLPALPRFRPLSALIEYWSNETLAQVERLPDGGLVREGLRVFKELSYTKTTDVFGDRLTFRQRASHGTRTLDSDRPQAVRGRSYLRRDPTSVQLQCETAITSR